MLSDKELGRSYESLKYYDKPKKNCTSLFQNKSI